MSSMYYLPTDPVSVVPLSEYSMESARTSLLALLAPLGYPEKITEGMTVVIKANLVSAMKPDEAATTHPVLLCALTDILVERGARVIVGDSPGGLYNAAFVGRVYNKTGMRELIPHGASLNDDFSEKAATFPEGKVLKEFTYTAYLDKADLIINFCKPIHSQVFIIVINIYQVNRYFNLV